MMADWPGKTDGLFVCFVFYFIFQKIKGKREREKTHPDVQLGWSVLLEGGGGGAGHLAGVFERLGAVPEENGARREVDEHQRAAAAEGRHAATHLQQVSLLLHLAADNVQPPSLRLVRLAALAALDRHPSWAKKHFSKKRSKNLK